MQPKPLVLTEIEIQAVLAVCEHAAARRHVDFDDRPDMVSALVRAKRKMRVALTPPPADKP